MCLWLSDKKKYGENIFFYILKVTEERSRIRVGSGSADMDPHQKVTDTQH
jgi:hypothetical protein